MANRPLVYITRRIPQKGVEILLQECDVKQWDSEQAAPRGELIHCVVGADAILCMPGDVIDSHVMDAAGPQLQVIATISESNDHIDCEECRSRDIKVITCPLQPAKNLADLTVALVLLTIKNSLTDEERKSLLKSLSVSEEAESGNDCPESEKNKANTVGSPPKIGDRPKFLRQMSEEQMAFQWSNGKPVNTNCITWKTIASKTFGIYGLTQTGVSVAKLLKSLGIQCMLAVDLDAEKSNDLSGETEPVFPKNGCNGIGDYSIVSLDELLSTCDIICVCGSPDSESAKIFTQESFKKMKNEAIIVTSSSEEFSVDYLALYEALREGQIKAAGLNDCNQVACPLKTMFLGLENCIFLPQSQESVYDTRHQVSIMVARNLICGLKSNRVINGRGLGN